ncbi:uncharacterized protein LOC17900216 [Capsella rubella]|uniref:uncharacterized protein LOC17900216 n=1 Tax=Capsella rubella TaxID=81985 RepID=UPI000CD4D727|nr:uncharacterized protein LOC17900216 [Capsella rubella]
MESMPHGVVRLRLPIKKFRVSPYSKETNIHTNYEKQKEEAVRLGVELSLFVAEAMLLLSNEDMFMFCFWLVKDTVNKDVYGPVVGRELDRFVSILRNKESSLGDDGLVINPSDFEHYKQELKKLEETLRSSKDVEVNGVERETIKSYILYLWKSLFETSQPKVINPWARILEMFRPFFNQAREDVCSSLIAS